MKNILAIPGSLRPASSSYAIINALVALAPGEISIDIYNDIGRLPHFDDSDPAPALVEIFRSKITTADGVLICTPEYAFGVPGSLKNALDWTVSSGNFVNKPVALITASSSGKYAHESLLLILKAISANVPDSAALRIPFIRSKINKEGKVIDALVNDELQKTMRALIDSIQ